jgi:4-amino-4-deoxy-L-arabinose transferase-like glycosyltransferase
MKTSWRQAALWTGRIIVLLFLLSALTAWTTDGIRTHVAGLRLKITSPDKYLLRGLLVLIILLFFDRWLREEFKKTPGRLKICLKKISAWVYLYRRQIFTGFLYLIRIFFFIFLAAFLLAWFSGGIETIWRGYEIQITSADKYLWRTLLLAAVLYAFDLKFRRLMDSIPPALQRLREFGWRCLRWGDSISAETGLKKVFETLGRIEPPLILMAFLATWTFFLTQPFGRDQASYLYIGREIALHGARPYIDWWSNKPPMLLYSYAAMVYLWGVSAVSINLAELALGALTTWLIYLFLRRAASRPIAILGGILYAVYAHPLLISKESFYLVAQPESFSQPLVTGAMLLSFIALRRQERFWPLIPAGFLLGVAFFYKYNFLLYTGPVALALLVFLFQGEFPWRCRWRRFLSGSAFFALGWLAGAGAVVLLCWMRGHLLETWQASFVFNREIYLPSSPFTMEGLFSRAWRHLSDRMLDNYQGVIWIGSLLFGLLTLFRRPRPSLWLLASWPLFGFASITSNRMFFANHFPQIYPALCITSALLVHQLSSGEIRWLHFLQRPARALPAILGMVSFICLAQFLSQSPHTHFFFGATRWPVYLHQLQGYADGKDQSLPANHQVAEYLRENTQPGEAVFIWGFETMVYHLAGRPCGARYLYIDHLEMMEEAGMPPENLYEPVIRQLEDNRITYLILVDNDRSTYKGTCSKKHFLNTPVLRRYLEEHFYLDRRIEDFTLFRRNPA